VFKVDYKRRDLEDTVRGVQLTPEFGLSAWFSISGAHDHALLLGDLPLRQEEVSKVLKTVIDSGVSATSLHNRFTMDSSRVMSLHIEGMGTQEAMSQALGKIYSTLVTLKANPEKPALMTFDVSHSKLDQATMESLLWKGEMSNGVFKVEVPRGTTLMNQELGKPSGAVSWAAFAGHDDKVVVNGDIASLEDELPLVLDYLLDADIEITSIHTHMVQESPKLVFVHFFGVGELEPIAQAVKDAIWAKEEFQSQ
jgi:hypothetical protein